MESQQPEHHWGWLKNQYVRRVLMAVGLALGVAVLLWLAWQVTDVLLLVFGGVLLAMFLLALSNPLKAHTPLGHRTSVGVVILAIVALIGLGGWLVGPQLARQVDQLSQTIPQSIGQLESTVAGYSWGEWLLNRTPSVSELMPQRVGFLSRATGIVSSTLGALASAGVVLFIGFYVALDPHLYRGGLLHLIPISDRARAVEVLDAVGTTLRGWILGQVVSMSIIGLLTVAGLWLLNVPLALALGLIAGLLEFIPTLGPYLAAIPALLLALTISPQTALYVLLLYVVIQFIESNVITPLVMQKAADLPPAMTIGGLVLFGVLFGPLGVLFATPILAVVRVLVKMLYIEDMLGDPVAVDGEEKANEEGASGNGRIKVQG